MPSYPLHLHLQQASMQGQDPDKQIKSDLTAVLNRGADVVGITEIASTQRAMIQAVCSGLGYWPCLPPSGSRGETGVLVRLREGVKVLASGSEKISDGKPGPASSGGYAPRFITWVLLDWHGERVTVFEGHWVTGFDRSPTRAELHEQMTRAMAAAVDKAGKGAAVSFFMGDTNIDERTDQGKNPSKPHAIFAEEGLLTCWDELGKYPPTHGKRTIDVIGSRDGDQRVSCTDARIWPKLHSDHRQVSAYYDIAEQRQKPPPADYPPPSPVYLGPPSKFSAGSNKPVRRIVLHSTVSPCEEGGARNVAAYFRSPAAAGSAHYVVDPGEVVQVGWDSLICWHAPPNPNSIGVEMCEYPSQNKARWQDKNHRRMLKRTALLVAELCLAYDVPVQRLGVKRLKAGEHGITGHVQVSRTWHQSTHWDPGAFPWDTFMRLVRTSVENIKDGKP